MVCKPSRRFLGSSPKGVQLLILLTLKRINYEDYKRIKGKCNEVAK